MKKLLRVLPLAALLLVGVASSTASATAASATTLTTSRIPIEWSEGWSAGRAFVASVNAQYGTGSAQSREIFESEIELYLPDGGTVNDLEDDWQKGYVYALQVALR